VNGVLQRLVGRAMGEASGNLRPRLPSRFEASLHATGWQDIHAAVPTASEPSAGLAPRAAQPALRPAPRASDSPPAPLPQVVQQTAGAPMAPQPPKVPHTHATSRSAPPPVAAPAAAPPPLLPEAATAPALQGLQPPVDPPSPNERSAPGRTLPPPVAPTPLLSADPRPHRIQVPDVALPRHQSAPVAEGQPAAPGAPEPEVVIHIGRLDIRTDRPKPAPTPRAVRPSGMPSLADYLRGGRS